MRTRSLCVLILVATAAPARAVEDPKAAARALINEGNTLYAAGDYAAALARYQSAYDMYPSPKIFFNLAKTNDKLGNPAAAVAFYDRFLAEGGIEPGSSLYRDASAAREAIAATLGRLTFQANVLGAKLFVDGKEAGQMPRDPLLVAAGTHEVVAQLPGYSTFHGNVTVGAGETQALTITLEPQIAATEPTPPPSPAPAITEPPSAAPTSVEIAAESEGSSIATRWWFWAGIALVAGGAVTAGVLASGSGTAAAPAELGTSAWSDWGRP
ncbi:MAG: PEGA domain-containing protein [Deltaproteobacteria bacterium]|nr:PEGA domain-containing protein [Deltaproteobacteria bacterium]